MDPSGNKVARPMYCFCKPCQLKRPLPKLIYINKTLKDITKK